MNRTVRGAGLIMLVLLTVVASSVLAADKPDLSTPKKAAKSFAAAVQSADMTGVKAASTGSPEDYKMMESFAGVISAGARLRKAAVAKFGAEDGKKIVQGSPDLPAQIEQSDEKIDGDTATLVHTGEDPANALKLMRTNGDWKVDLNRIPGKDQMAKSMPMMKELQKVLDESTTDVKDGKFKTADEAQQAVRTRMMAVVTAMFTQQPPAAPGPATQQGH